MQTPNTELKKSSTLQTNLTDITNTTSDKASVVKTPPKTKRPRKPRFGRTARSPDKEIRRGYAPISDSPQFNEILIKKIKERDEKIRLVKEDKDKLLKTPSGTVVKPLADMGPLRIYESRDSTPKKATKINERNEDSDILSSLVDPPANNRKYIKHIFTKKDLAAIKLEYEKNGKRRLVAQDTAMAKEDGIFSKIAAKDAAKEYGYDSDNIQWEWSHLVAHRMIGTKGQDPENLLLTTKDTNTLMMFVEEKVQHLLDDASDKATVILTVSCELEDNSHMGKNISYDIVCEERDFHLAFKFDPKSCYKPQDNIADYVTPLFQAALELKKVKNVDSADKQTLADQPKKSPKNNNKRRLPSFGSFFKDSSKDIKPRKLDFAADTSTSLKTNNNNNTESNQTFVLN